MIRRAFLFTLLIVGGCILTPSRVVPQPATSSLGTYRVQVHSVRPHDREAFTQGLLYHEGRLYESTGLEGRSSLRRVHPVTGEVELKVDLPAEYFGEGLALVGDRLIQLTWKNGKALVWRLSTFEQIGEFDYEGEGWGLAYDGTRLLMTDGSSTITFRDPEDFSILGEINVTADGQPVGLLNELEWVEGILYANVFQTDVIVKIDPTTGSVLGVINAAGLISPQERAKADVLNGIAYDTDSRSFLITGKLWPRLFEVDFVPVRR
jgi:glutamine cyclotransferase